MDPDLEPAEPSPLEERNLNMLSAVNLWQPKIQGTQLRRDLHHRATIDKYELVGTQLRHKAS